MSSPLGQPSIIAFVSQTGNVMKTTLAAAVGVALGEAGIPTLAIDLDKEHRALGASLETWAAERATSHPDRVQLDVRPADTAEEALALARTSGRQIVIIDCPSRATAATAHIAGAADCVTNWRTAWECAQDGPYSNGGNPRKCNPGLVWRLGER